MKKFELIAIGLIVCLGAFLRLYHLPDTLMFRGDQGRDAILAKNILKEKDIALIGPVTSVGNMYLGPLYYYFMVPFLALTYPNPVGPAYGVALLNILTIYLIYWVGKKTINTGTGMVAAVIFALMPMAIIYGRFSWNPNIAPFFSILIFYTLYCWLKNRSWKMFGWSAFLIGLLAQTHYVSLTVAGMTGVLWVLKLIKEKNVRLSLKELLAGIIGFGITTVPQIIFDFRHNHLISQQFAKFFTSPEKHLGSTGLVDYIVLVAERTEYVLASLLHDPGQFGFDQYVLIIGLMLAAFLVIKNKTWNNSGLKLLILWLATSILGTSFYSHTTYPHYLTFCFPIIALFWGQLIGTTWKGKYWFGNLLLGGVILFVMLPGLKQVGWKGNGTRILEQATNQTLPYITPPYNIALLSDDKDYKGMSYRYFFEVSQFKPNSLEDYSNLNTLVLIDETFLEDPKLVPIYEIELAKKLSLEKKIIIPNGPWVYVFKRG